MLDAVGGAEKTRIVIGFHCCHPSNNSIPILVYSMDISVGSISSIVIGFIGFAIIIATILVTAVAVTVDIVTVDIVKIGFDIDFDCYHASNIIIDCHHSSDIIIIPDTVSTSSTSTSNISTSRIIAASFGGCIHKIVQERLCSFQCLVLQQG